MTFSDLPPDLQKRRKLNLGCGFFPKKDFLNVDRSEVQKPDFLHDLDVMPWPFPDAHYELIELDHVLEHLADVAAVIGELERVLAPGGTLVIRVPHFSRGHTHWDHKHGFDFSFMIYFDPRSSGGFEKSTLVPMRTRFTWFAQPYHKRQHLGPASYFVGTVLGRLFDFIGNLNLPFTSRLFCFWVGGYDEISFTLQKPAH